jgi:tetratricopeptide (TPR) repeat protein
LENNLGYVLVRQGQLDAAASHLHRALDLCEQNAVPHVQVYVLNSIGELHLARGEDRLAHTQLLRAVEAAVALRDRDSEATARQLLGRANLHLGDEVAADEAYAGAVDLLEQLRLPERLRDCAMEYADLLHRWGRLEDSIAYWRVAAEAGARSIGDSDENAAVLRQSGA